MFNVVVYAYFVYGSIKDNIRESLLSKYCIVEWVHATLICMQDPVLMQVTQDAVTWASAGDFQIRATATVMWTAISMETAAVTLGRRVNPHSVRKC